MLQLPPSQFTYGKYGLDVPFRVLTDDKLHIDWLLGQHIIGYCNSLGVEIRPRAGNMAVMFSFDDGDWEGWHHIPINVWNKFLEKKKEVI